MKIQRNKEMAKVTITLENGSNSASLVKESSIDGIREAITSLMSLVLSVEWFEAWIGKPDREQRIPCIRAIRQVSGLGLREAKDLTDTLEVGGIKAIPTLLVHRDKYSEVHKALSEFFEIVELRPR
jgi:hypothetical protein